MPPRGGARGRRGLPIDFGRRCASLHAPSDDSLAHSAQATSPPFPTSCRSPHPFHPPTNRDFVVSLRLCTLVASLGLVLHIIINSFVFVSVFVWAWTCVVAPCACGPLPGRVLYTITIYHPAPGATLPTRPKVPRTALALQELWELYLTCFKVGLG